MSLRKRVETLAASALLVILLAPIASVGNGSAYAHHVPPHDLSHASDPTKWCAVHIARNELVQALSDCNYALSLDPENVQALSNRGSIYILAKDPRAAVTDLSWAIVLRPDDAALHYNRGLAQDELGRSDLALADFTEAIRLRPGFAAAFHNRGYLFERLGQRANAIADYEAALRVEPDLEPSRRRLNQLRRSL